MRKSHVTLALLVAAVTLFTGWAQGQDVQPKAGRMMGRPLEIERSRAALGTGAAGDTGYIGHGSNATPAVAPNFVYRGPYRPGVSHDGVWDFDDDNGGALDSLQGWVPYVIPVNDGQNFANNNDNLRPWVSLDIGNRISLEPIQGRAYGVTGVWHRDGGSTVPSTPTAGFEPAWAPLGGGFSAWCGLRCDGDLSYRDEQAFGGTGMPITGDALAWQEFAPPTAPNITAYPGYADQ